MKIYLKIVAEADVVDIDSLQDVAEAAINAVNDLETKMTVHEMITDKCEIAPCANSPVTGEQLFAAYAKAIDGDCLLWDQLTDFNKEHYNRVASFLGDNTRLAIDAQNN